MSRTSSHSSLARPAIRWLTGPGALLTTSGMAIAALVLMTAPAADAKPIQEGKIKSECRSANGGTYHTEIVHADGLVDFRFSTCTYSDISGNRYTDRYVNGEYSGTDDLPSGGKRGR